MNVPAYFYNQSAVIPYRETEEGLEILVITSRKGKRWVLPKGVAEPDMHPADSAAKEAYEEAGAQGQPRHEPIGTYSYPKWGGICRVQVFPMRVQTLLQEWPESWRRREWVHVATAVERVREEALKDLLREFEQTFA